MNINENFFCFTLASKWLIQRKCVMYFSTFGVEFLKVEWMQRGQLTQEKKQIWKTNGKNVHSFE